MSKRTRYSASSSVPHWQPISQLPLIAEMIDRQQESAAEVLHTLEAAREHPGALDDATVDRMIRLHSQQLEDVWVYDGQLQQWATQTLTDAQRREVDRLTGQAKKLRETLTAAVALAGELKPTTIESLLRMDDAELGLQTRCGAGRLNFGQSRRNRKRRPARLTPGWKIWRREVAVKTRCGTRCTPICRYSSK